MYSITVTGKSGKQYSFNFEASAEHVDQWHKEGFQIDEIVNVIPEWLPSPLVRVWCFLQDIYNFRFLKS